MDPQGQLYESNNGIVAIADNKLDVLRIDIALQGMKNWKETAYRMLFQRATIDVQGQSNFNGEASVSNRLQSDPTTHRHSASGEREGNSAGNDDLRALKQGTLDTWLRLL